MQFQFFFIINEKIKSKCNDDELTSLDSTNKIKAPQAKSEPLKLLLNAIPVAFLNYTQFCIVELSKIIKPPQ